MYLTKIILLTQAVVQGMSASGAGQLETSSLSQVSDDGKRPCGTLDLSSSKT